VALLSIVALYLLHAHEDDQAKPHGAAGLPGLVQLLFLRELVIATVSISFQPAFPRPEIQLLQDCFQFAYALPWVGGRSIALKSTKHKTHFSATNPIPLATPQALNAFHLKVYSTGKRFPRHRPLVLPPHERDRRGF
jgi:hypothetical protein